MSKFEKLHKTARANYTDDILDITERTALWLLPTVGTHEQIRSFSTVAIPIVAVLFVGCKGQAAFGRCLIYISVKWYLGIRIYEQIRVCFTFFVWWDAFWVSKYLEF